MIISDTAKFVFIHNPKAGGMAFRTALAQYDTRCNAFFEWKTVGDQQIDMAHITPYQLHRFYRDTFDQIRDYYRFGFVRNPYDRYLSAVSQHLKLSTRYIRKALLQQPDLFYSIARNMAEHVLDQHAIEQDHRLVHFRRQSNFFYFENKIWASKTFKLEEARLITDPDITTWMGSALSAPRNQTTEFSQSGYDITQLGTATIKRINTFYAVDFERFAYAQTD